MDYIEHYFENLLFNGEDVVNGYYLRDNEKEIIEICVNYVLYSLFNGREHLMKWLDEKDNDWWWE